jgi:lipopolysaccharide assembly outer membrane protein LptD (OstA)
MMLSGTTLRCRAARALALAVLLSSSASAATGLGSALSFGLAPTTNAPILANGERVEMDKLTGWVTVSGKAIVSWGEETLQADRIRVNTTNRVMEADGHVVLTRPSGRWTGDKLTYRFGSDSGEAQGMAGTADPFRVWASHVDRVSRTESRLKDATITTCTNEKHSLHFLIKARELDIKDGESLGARGATWYMGPVPVFYLPVWRRNLRAESGWHFRPGYDSRMGAFLLSSYRQGLFPWLRSETHIDYRSSRGWAAGEDLLWRGEDFRGSIRGYYADDLDPLDPNDDPLLDSLGSERYRIGLRHEWAMSPKDQWHIRADYLSDTDVLEDFFELESLERRQPENFVAFTHREDSFSVSAIVIQRLNDFYATLNRQPEVAVDVSRQSIAGSDIYYAGRTAAAMLEQTAISQLPGEPYSAFRLDSDHVLYYPKTYAGFLNVVPRFGYRATYYSVTREFDAVSSGTGTVEDSTTFIESEGGGRLRSVFEAGVETSFRAFRVWLNDGDPIRHVVEPYANLTIVPEPTLTADKLLQFDDTDGLAEVRTVRFGVRNKLQTKRENMARDWIDVNLYADWDLMAKGEEEPVPFAYLAADITPIDWFRIDLDAKYDVELEKISKADLRLYCDPGRWWSAAVGYRFRNESSQLLSAELSLKPLRSWTVTSGTRYEFEGDGQLQEQSAAVQYNWDCMALRVGGRVIPGYTLSNGGDVPDEWRVMVEFWFTAFPEFGISGRSGL